MDLCGMNIHPLKTYPDQKFFSTPSVIPKFSAWNSNDFGSGRISTVCTEQIALPTTYFCSHEIPGVAMASLFLPYNLHTGRDACT